MSQEENIPVQEEDEGVDISSDDHLNNPTLEQLGIGLYDQNVNVGFIEKDHNVAESILRHLIQEGRPPKSQADYETIAHAVHHYAIADSSQVTPAVAYERVNLLRQVSNPSLGATPDQLASLYRNPNASIEEMDQAVNKWYPNAELMKPGHSVSDGTLNWRIKRDGESTYFYPQFLETRERDIFVTFKDPETGGLRQQRMKINVPYELVDNTGFSHAIGPELEQMMGFSAGTFMNKTFHKSMKDIPKKHLSRYMQFIKRHPAASRILAPILTMNLISAIGDEINLANTSNALDPSLASKSSKFANESLWALAFDLLVDAGRKVSKLPIKRIAQRVFMGDIGKRAELADYRRLARQFGLPVTPQTAIPGVRALDHWLAYHPWLVDKYTRRLPTVMKQIQRSVDNIAARRGKDRGIMSGGDINTDIMNSRNERYTRLHKDTSEEYENIFHTEVNVPTHTLPRTLSVPKPGSPIQVTVDDIAWDDEALKHIKRPGESERVPSSLFPSSFGNIKRTGIQPTQRNWLGPEKPVLFDKPGIDPAKIPQFAYDQAKKPGHPNKALQTIQRALKPGPAETGALKTYGRHPQFPGEPGMVFTTIDEIRIKNLLDKKQGIGIQGELDRSLSALTKSNSEQYKQSISKLQNFKEDIADGKMTIGEARKILSSITTDLRRMRKVEGFNTSDAAYRNLSSAQDAIRNEIGWNLKRINVGNLYGRWNKVQRKFRLIKENDEVFINALQKQREQMPLFDSIMAGKAEGGDALLDIFKGLDPTQQAQLSSVFIRRMGKVNPAGGRADDFSFSKFVEDYDKLSTNYKDLIFGGKISREITEDASSKSVLNPVGASRMLNPLQQYRQDIDKVVDVLRHFKDEGIEEGIGVTAKTQRAAKTAMVTLPLLPLLPFIFSGMLPGQGGQGGQTQADWVGDDYVGQSPSDDAGSFTYPLLSVGAAYAAGPILSKMLGSPRLMRIVTGEGSKINKLKTSWTDYIAARAGVGVSASPERQSDIVNTIFNTMVSEAEAGEIPPETLQNLQNFLGLTSSLLTGPLSYDIYHGEAPPLGTGLIGGPSAAIYSPGSETQKEDIKEREREVRALAKKMGKVSPSFAHIINSAKKSSRTRHKILEARFITTGDIRKRIMGSSLMQRWD